MSDASFDDDVALMSRLGINEEQLAKVSVFTSIVTRDLDVGTAATLYGASVDEVTAKRYSVIKILHLADQMLDEEIIEREGSLPPTLTKSEDGECSVGEYSNYSLGRAVLDSFEGHQTIKECGDEWGFSEEVVNYGRNLYYRILLYLSAEAIKTSPYLTALGLFDRISNVEDFVQLRGLAEVYLKEDDAECDAEYNEEPDTESEFDLGLDGEE